MRLRINNLKAVIPHPGAGAASREPPAAVPAGTLDPPLLCTFNIPLLSGFWRWLLLPGLVEEQMEGAKAGKWVAQQVCLGVPAETQKCLLVGGQE